MQTKVMETKVTHLTVDLRGKGMFPPDETDFQPILERLSSEGWTLAGFKWGQAYFWKHQPVEAPQTQPE